jgi:hypothetical protein
VNGYLILVDAARYVAQAETAGQAEQRVREALGPAAQRIDVARPLTDAELVALQLRPGEVRLEPAEHG